VIHPFEEHDPKEKTMPCNATWLVIIAFGFLLLAATGCRFAEGKLTTVSREPFGQTADGRQADLFLLENVSGMKVGIIEYGGIVVSIDVPDREGRFTNVVLGFDSLDDYLHKNKPHFGALIGRYGNRIAKGRFVLDGVEYTLAKNNGENHLHGGIRGFDRVWWKGEIVDTEYGRGLRLSYTSRDMEEGYPGTLNVAVVYSLTEDNGLVIDYFAETDKKTVVNLTNHSYFNLRGSGDILGHEMMIAAESFTPVDEGLIPTGELRPVKGTPMDFLKPTAIGARIESNDEQIRLGMGYDHNFMLRRSDDSLSLAARVRDPETGRVMLVLTTQPGVQFYSGNFLDGTLTGHGQAVYHRRSGFCLETQHYPDSPNKPDFPPTTLEPGERYHHRTVYKFGVD
jgi:aldose 1-epimerase